MPVLGNILNGKLILYRALQTLRIPAGLLGYVTARRE